MPLILLALVLLLAGCAQTQPKPQPDNNIGAIPGEVYCINGLDGLWRYHGNGVFTRIDR